MLQSSRIVALEIVGTVVAAVGAIDGLRAGKPAIAALFAVVGLLGVLRVLMVQRVPLPLRRDNETWLREAAAVTGESAETVADRAVGMYRQALGDGR